MPSISMRQLLEAGVHFGHQTRRWNPKMKPFIFAERNGIHIIDLAQTAQRLQDALDFVSDTVASGDSILFVGTKKQAQEPVYEHASRAEMPYVNHRWLGGMLTNFVTIRKRVGLLDQLEARQASGDFERLSKKEASRLTDEMMRLHLRLGGVRKMRRLPGAIFVVDPVRERIAVTEARRLEIPVIATGDTNVDPDMIDYIIPANDDAIRSIRLLCQLVADAAIEGLGQRAARAAEEPPMGAEVADAEAASDEMIAAVAAGGTYSFAPEPDEDEAVLPGEAETEASGAAVSEAAAGQASAPEASAPEAPAPQPETPAAPEPEAPAPEQPETPAPEAPAPAPEASAPEPEAPATPAEEAPSTAASAGKPATRSRRTSAPKRPPSETPAEEAPATAAAAESDEASAEAAS